MNKRTEIINENPYDPEKSKDHCDKVVFFGHDNIEYACYLKNKDISSFLHSNYIIKAKHYTIYLFDLSI